ncbi:CoA-binding protein [Chloroflexota bacterium]
MKKDEYKKLDRLFNPRSVAVIGDRGKMWLRNLSSFKGELYSVQTDEREYSSIEAMGIRHYYNIIDIPDEIDYVIVSVPSAATPQIIEDCIRKKVAGVMLFTAGFAETITEEGIKLQEIITNMAREADLKIIGPNCMGIFNPKIGLRHNVDQYLGDSGPVGFISQSGTFAGLFSLAGAVHGIKISKSVSYGNAVVLDSTDYLEYFAEDDETEIIGMYIEWVRDGRRLYECLRKTIPKKPILIWKGGQTEEGVRATISHTAAIAQSGIIWDTLIHQSGALKVDSLDEIIDVTKALIYARPTSGNRVALIAMTGGPSVGMTDAFVKAGFEVPRLTDKSYREFALFLDRVGGSYRNPLDIISNLNYSMETLLRILNILDSDTNIDSVVLDLSSMAIMRKMVESQESSGNLKRLVDTLTDFKEKSAKPFMAVINPMHREGLASELRDSLTVKGIVSYPNYERAAKTLMKLVGYYRFVLNIETNNQ